MSWLQHSPPERIEIAEFALERNASEHIELLIVSINESLEHLGPWMEWAQKPAIPETYERLLPKWRSHWDRRSDFQYLLTKGNFIIGGIGAHDRVGPGTLEIGYWLHPAATGRGVMTRAADGLRKALFEIPEVERIVIRCDKGNKASAAVPQRLGFNLAHEVEQDPVTSGQTGRFLEFELRRT